jgi:hypothetical protein
LIYAWFIHREARPVDGISDCQWHVHCIVVNATFDEQEKLFRPSKRPSAMSITQTKMAQSILANLPKVRPIPQWNRTKSGETVGRER